MSRRLRGRVDRLEQRTRQSDDFWELLSAYHESARNRITHNIALMAKMKVDPTPPPPPTPEMVAAYEMRRRQLGIPVPDLEALKRKIRADLEALGERMKECPTRI